MLQPTSGRRGFHFVTNSNEENSDKTNMLRMLHNTSGRQNFNVVKPDEKNPPKQEASNDQQKTIEQQTNDAIKTASQANTNDEKKDSK